MPKTKTKRGRKPVETGIIVPENCNQTNDPAPPPWEKPDRESYPLDEWFRIDFLLTSADVTKEECMFMGMMFEKMARALTPQEYRRLSPLISKLFDTLNSAC